MSEYTVTVSWQRNNETFIDNNYSRAHLWRFDGGVEVPASSSPYVVPLPFSNPANVDPEEAYVAAISSCHMLTFLGIAAKKKLLVESYTDAAVGIMEPNEAKYEWVSKVTLRPRIVFGGAEQPTAAQIEQIHHLAHKNCFIANSVKTEIVVELPQL